MRKIRTLKLNKEFKRAYYSRSFKAHPMLVTYRVRNSGGETRIGITSSKKIGCAVKRNRSRRIIRAAFYELLKECPEYISGYDFVFVARNSTTEIGTNEIKEVMKKQLMSLMCKKQG